ncbi:MAG: hypothetical protein FD143_2806 [Ignavibacteria bacterium]|nr:MAG: hypothetical protein FD143_2806 [Ignavibacteria bacterium]KAF0160186.1 MAG: hypothetical protein FD188_2000 [Ignavibacteria bacterium]
MRKALILAALLFSISTNQLFAQANLLEKLLKENPDKFGNVLANLDSHEVQIIYTQINRDKNNFPKFKTFTFGVDPKKYFYPASTVKLPTALLALEKINNLRIKGLNKFTSLSIDSARHPQTSVITDTSSESGFPTVANYIKKIFLVSDNDAYCRLYEFVGQKEHNESLHKKGFKNVKITNRYTGGFNTESNRYTNPFRFYNRDKIIYLQPEQYNAANYDFELNGVIKGKGYLDSKDSLINKPFDFSAKNYVSLEDLTEILKAVLFPETRNAQKRFYLTKDDYNFLYKYMSMLPKESKHPGYDSTHYDSFVKYFLFGDSKKPIPNNIRIFNKVGLAYGYLTDLAYIVDFENKIEFLLSAVIHVNKDQIYNDGIYEYDSTAMPFLANLGRVIFNFEKCRTKKYLPNLEKFKIKY